MSAISGVYVCVTSVSLPLRFTPDQFPVPVSQIFRRGSYWNCWMAEVGERAMSYSDALAISEPIRLVVTRHNERGERDLLGTHDLDWQSILTEESGRWSGTAELSGVGGEAKISSGLLELRLEIFPKSPPLERVFLTGHREAERQRSSERERLFLVYSKQWWREFLQIRAEHSQRMVKIFALDESGRNRCVCSFVWPLRAGRLLDGPQQAARFVSLVPLERAGSPVGVGGRGGGELWSSLHTILCQRKGVSQTPQLTISIISPLPPGCGGPLLFALLSAAWLWSAGVRVSGNKD